MQHAGPVAIDFDQQRPGARHAQAVELLQPLAAAAHFLGLVSSGKRRRCSQDGPGRFLVQDGIVEMVILAADAGEQFDALAFRSDQEHVQVVVVGVRDLQLHIQVGDQLFVGDLDLGTHHASGRNQLEALIRVFLRASG